MVLGALMLSAVAGMTPPALPMPQDTAAAVQRLMDELTRRYWSGARPPCSRTGTCLPADYRCTPDAGADTCLGSDWVYRWCMPNESCDPPKDRILGALREEVAAAPQSGFVTGQAVFALARFDQDLEAFEVADSCLAHEWWCAALRGYVFADVGRLAEAEPRLRDFVSSAPDSIACAHGDATWLIGSWSWLASRAVPTGPKEWDENWSLRSCSDRLAASDTLMWLADPLYMVEGNDRWVAHMVRGLNYRWYQDATFVSTPARIWPQSWLEALRAKWVRRGRWDSRESGNAPRSTNIAMVWTSKTAARYHFVPDFEGEGFDRPSWRLSAEFEDEGYTPPYAPFYELPLQIARFRASSSTMQRVATAGRVTGSEIEGAAESGYLVFTDAPESFPLQLEAPFHEGRAVYLAEAEARPHAVSFEVLTSAGIGWHREWLEPLRTEGPGLSDLLLYRPTGMAEPDSLLPAAALMHGATTLEPGELGLYWELYEVTETAPVEFTLEARHAEDGGLIGRLLRRIPGGGQEEGTGRVVWIEPSAGVVHRRAIILDLRDLGEGAYDLVLRARWNGGEAESTRRIEVRD